MKERIAVVDGVRTPFCKAAGVFKDWEADDLGAFAVKELLARNNIPGEEIDELIFGNVLAPPVLSNVARVIGIKAGLPESLPAFTINCNCSSGLQAVTSAVDKLWTNHADIMIAGASESMSHVPITFSNEIRGSLFKMMKAKDFKQKLAALFSFRPSHFAPQVQNTYDLLSGLNMGETAEVLVRQCRGSRKEQDEFGHRSQKLAHQALKSGKFAEEIVPIPRSGTFTYQLHDDGIREDSSIESLENLKPVFNKYAGSVTAGTSSQVTDGAAALLLMRESTAKKLGLEPLGYITEYTTAALDPSRMGLGPAYVISKLLEKTGKKLEEIELFEINEAFAAQVIAVEKALASDDFAKKELGREKAVGVIDREKLNVNGGAIALGHPFGASGPRLVLTLLKEMRRRGNQVGIASLCVGGGQGEAVLVEVN